MSCPRPEKHIFNLADRTQIFTLLFLIFRPACLRQGPECPLGSTPPSPPAVAVTQPNSEVPLWASSTHRGSSIFLSRGVGGVGGACSPVPDCSVPLGRVWSDWGRQAAFTPGEEHQLLSCRYPHKVTPLWFCHSTEFNIFRLEEARTVTLMTFCRL